MINYLVGIWYDGPTEVRFRIAPNKFHLGIAFHDYIVDLSDGQSYRVDDILYNAVEAGELSDDAIVEWCEWVPLSDIIDRY